jgi:tripartite-type tricarboxylate transporter receptor subunit TctC
MDLYRRQLLRSGALAVAGLLITPVARAQTYPSRPVRFLIGFAPGGPIDAVARPLADALAERLGQAFLVEYRSGAGSTIAAEAVIRSAPDGYTLFITSPASAINQTLYENLSFNFVRDSAPVAGIVRLANVLLVHPSVPAATVSELIAFAKANPGKLNFGAATGTSLHLSAELFKFMTGAQIVHVPYKGAAPALTDLLGGQIQMMFNAAPLSVEYVRGGKLRALGVTSTTRLELLPEVPPIADVLPGYEVSNWYGVVAPKDTPQEIVSKLNQAIEDSLRDPKIKTRFVELGGTLLEGSPQDFGKFVADETEKWSKVVKFAGLKPE